MESDEKKVAAAKVVGVAGKWYERRLVKIAATGDAKTAAQTRLRESEHELAEAVEKYKKVER